MQKLKDLPQNPTFSQYVVVSLEARLLLLPLEFVGDLQPEIALCQSVIAMFQKGPTTDISKCLGSFSLEATRAFDGYVLVQEGILPGGDYPKARLIKIIKHKMELLSIMFSDFEKGTLQLHVINAADGIDFEMMIIEKKDFLAKAPTWLVNIDVEAKKEQVEKFITRVATIEIRDSTCPISGFVGMFGDEVYVFPGRRAKTRRHEWAHGLLRALDLDRDVSNEQRLETALQVSPAKHPKLRVNGRFIEAGWHFEVECLGTDSSEFPDEWPFFFSIEETDRLDE